MKPTDKMNNDKSAFLFNVDILVHGDTNPVAMERLLHLLNQCGFSDYRINSGIELGKLIDFMEAQASVKSNDQKSSRNAVKSESNAAASPSSARPPAASSKKAASVSNASDPSDVQHVVERIKACIKENKLIRLTVNKGYGVKLNIPCRVISFDQNKQTITVYHVDEKKVYSFSLIEIDDFLI